MSTSLILQAVGCTDRAQFRTARIDTEGFMGVTKSLEEVISQYPELSSGMESYCRSVDPLMEAPEGALNPAIPVRASDTPVEFVIFGNASLGFVPQVKVEGRLVSTTIANLHRSVSGNVVGYSSVTPGQDSLVSLLRLGTLVHGHFLFGTLHFAFSGKIIERNLLCSVQPSVFKLSAAEGTNESSVGTLPESLIHVAHPSDLGSSNSQPIPAFVYKRWESECLDLGGQSFKYELDLSGSAAIEMRAKQWLVHASTPPAERCRLSPDVVQVLELSSQALWMTMDQEVRGRGYLNLNQFRFLSTVYLSYLNLNLPVGYSPFSKDIWYNSAASNAAFTPLQLSIEVGAEVGIRFSVGSSTQLRIIFTLPSPSTDDYSRQAAVSLHPL